MFVGGFSYADVLESAKGWAGTIRYNSGLWASFQAFYTRPDTWYSTVITHCAHECIRPPGPVLKSGTLSILWYTYAR